MAFFAFGLSMAWHGLLNLLDPNKPLLPKIVILSVAFILVLLTYLFQNRKKRN